VETDPPAHQVVLHGANLLADYCLLCLQPDNSTIVKPVMVAVDDITTIIEQLFITIDSIVKVLSIGADMFER
jgi:hypothetical protein